MGFMKKNFGKMVSAFAFLVAVCSVNSTCVYVVHQPKVPESAMKLKN